MGAGPVWFPFSGRGEPHWRYLLETCQLPHLNLPRPRCHQVSQRVGSIIAAMGQLRVEG
jgi:hypothetical protein